MTDDDAPDGMPLTPPDTHPPNCGLIWQLAMVAYVPDGAHNKSADKVDIKAWIDEVGKATRRMGTRPPPHPMGPPPYATWQVCKATGGKVTKPPAPAKSPKGGKFATAIVKSDPEKGARSQYVPKLKSMMPQYLTIPRKHSFADDDS